MSSTTEPFLVLFDCDGTLIDSAGVIVAVMHLAFEQAGVPPVDDDAVRGIIGLSLPIAIGRLLDIDPQSRQAAELTDLYKRQFMEYRSSGDFAEPVFGGVDAMLEAVMQRPPVSAGVVTGKSRRGLQIVASHHNFEWLLPISRTADECVFKPAPDMVLECCAQSGIDEGRTLVVGDTSYDMEMAKAAGARAIGVSWGYHEPEMLLAAGAETVLEHPTHLLPLIDEALTHA
ncbi:MAG: HAD-IA family hydrolase [Pseudomonadota bacterium]